MGAAVMDDVTNAIASEIDSIAIGDTKEAFTREGFVD